MPFDVFAIAKLLARVVEHRRADIRGDEAPRRIEALARMAREKPRAARNLQYVARRIARQAPRELGGMRIEPSRPEILVVVLRPRESHLRGGLNEADDVAVGIAHVELDVARHRAKRDGERCTGAGVAMQRGVELLVGEVEREAELL